MKRTIQIARTVSALSSIGLFLAFAGSRPAAAQTDPADGRWSFKLQGMSVQSTFGGDFNSSSGGGLGFEYRASRRLGIEAGVFTSQVKSQTDFDFFGLIHLGVESKLRVTPVTAQLNFHLTPDHHVDLHLGPVVGWMRYGDLESTVRSSVLGDESVETERVRTKDAFAWGAHIDVDVPLGQHGAFFTGGATYLNAPVKTRQELEGVEAGDTTLHLDPLVLKVGVGYRF
jgi:outer membrane protein W